MEQLQFLLKEKFKQKVPSKELVYNFLEEYTGYFFSEFKILRIPPIILRRIYRHFAVRSSRKPIPLKYNRLRPNYSLHLGCDEDAASSIDPVDVIRFYESRGFKMVQELSLIKKVLYPNKYIAMIKLP